MHRHSEHPASGTLSPTGIQWLPIWKHYLMIKAVDLSRITRSRAISRPWRKRDDVSTVLAQVHPSRIRILFDIVAMQKERALALYSQWIRRGIEILIANANQSVNVPATRLHCLTLFTVRLELAQDRLHCVLPLKQQQKKSLWNTGIHLLDPPVVLSQFPCPCQMPADAPLSWIPGRWRVTLSSAAATGWHR